MIYLNLSFNEFKELPFSILNLKALKKFYLNWFEKFQEGHIEGENNSSYVDDDDEIKLKDVYFEILEKVRAKIKGDYFSYEDLAEKRIEELSNEEMIAKIFNSIENESLTIFLLCYSCIKDATLIRNKEGLSLLDFALALNKRRILKILKLSNGIKNSSSLIL